MALENYANYLDQFDPMKADQAIETLRGAQTGNKLANINLLEKQREISDTQKLNDNYRNALDANGKFNQGTFESNLLNSGLGAKLPEIRKKLAEQEKLTAETSEKNAQTGKLKADTTKIDHDLAKSQYDIAGQIVGGWETDPSITKQKMLSSVDSALKAKIISPEAHQLTTSEIMALQDDPLSLKRYSSDKKMQILSAADQLKYLMADANTVANNKTSIETNAATNATSIANNKETNKTTRRGQDLVNERAIDIFNNSISKPIEVTGPDGKPTLVSQDKAGNLTPIVGYSPKSSSKSLTENQGKATALGMRAIQANSEIEDLLAQGYGGLSIADRFANAVPFDAGRSLMSDTGQKYENAQRNFVSAILRKESGAAISNSEFENERKKYFPQIGDSDAVKAQKATMRALGVKGLQAEAGDQGTSEMVKATSQTKPSKIASIKTDADYAALPSGATFISPDGKTRRKP